MMNGSTCLAFLCEIFAEMLDKRLVPGAVEEARITPKLVPSLRAAPWLGSAG